MNKEAKLFLTFNMLGDLKRSGPVQWKIDRFRTEDIKDHVFDLILLTKLVKPYLPSYVDTDKMIDYAIVHDLEEVITGDITGFEGITKEQKNKVNEIAMDYLIKEYGDVINLEKLLNEFEGKTTLEAKILHMIDKMDSSIAFMKYDSENKVDLDNPRIIKSLRFNKDVVKMKEQGLSLGEMFYLYHLRSVNFCEEEITKYKISKEDADMITKAIKDLMKSIHDDIPYTDKLIEDFPEDATPYRFINDKKTKLEAITIADSEEYLRQISKPVDLENDNIEKDIAILEEFCMENEVMAMAAVQLGIPKRLVYLKNTNIDIINKMQTNSETEEEKDYNEARVLVNPVIKSREGLTTFWEACASCLTNTALVKRPYRINVEYLDVEGNIHNDVFEGFEATVLSHEMDHLDGILHMDVADKVVQMEKEERKKLRQEQGYEILFKDGDYEELKKRG